MFEFQLKFFSTTLARGKLSSRGVPLKNITAQSIETQSNSLISLKWFNAYPSVIQKLNKGQIHNIFGKISFYNGCPQIINPEFEEIGKLNENLHREYPTINTLSGVKINSIILKIPDHLWAKIPSVVPSYIKKNISLTEAFNVLHKETNKWHSKKCS